MPAPHASVRAARRRSKLASAEPPGTTSEARLRAIIHTVVDGIITIDQQGQVESINPAMERIFGYKARELVGRNVSQLMPPPFCQQHDAHVQRYLRTGQARIIGIGREAVGLRKDGTTFPIDLAVSEWREGPRRMFTGVIRDITERKRTEQAIAAVTEEERRRFGRELHDGLGQQLTGVALLAKALQNKLAKLQLPAATEAGDIAELASRTLTDLKRQAHGLYPVELEQHGLNAALEELAANQRSLFGVACTFETCGRIPEFDTPTALHLYRIAQEAVHNGIRHGRAQSIAIRLERVETMMSLQIEDDGVGLPPRRSATGMGLTIMKHRASAVGGAMEIGPGARGGATVRVLWKLPARDTGKGT
jgi:two-component system CheB/CheR fusion protein